MSHLKATITGKSVLLIIVSNVIVLVGGLHAWDSEIADPCSTCCNKGLLHTVSFGTSEAIPGQNVCAPLGALEVTDGYGAVSFDLALANYVSATFDRANYTSTPVVGTWRFYPPSITYSSAGNTYGVRFSQTKYRLFSAGTGYWSGQSDSDNRFSKIYRSPTGFSYKAVLYDRAGTRFVFSDPNPGAGPAYLEKVLLVGGGRYEIEHSGGQVSKIWFWNPENSIYTSLWKYAAWGAYGPTTVDEYVAKQDVTSMYFNSSQWQKKKTTTFRYYQSGYQDATTGDLVAVDEETYLSNLMQTSLKRTVFKYYLEPTPWDQD